MKEITLESYGKINLGLDVLYKRPDEYHELSTIMQEINLKDIITIKEIKEGIIIESNNNNIPLNNGNLAYKACELIKEKMNINKGLHINIHKEIPVAAGLAGGSSNAAVVLKGLNQLWDLGLTEEELREMGKELGADVPYCIMGGTAYAGGIGEKLKPLKSFSGKNILLINPGIEISTEDVYGKLNLDQIEKMDMKNIIDAIEKNDIKFLSKNIKNTMEDVVIKEYPIIGEIKEDMISHGALGALMSGSGPTVFGIFDNEKILSDCKEKLSRKYNKALVIATETI